MAQDQGFRVGQGFRVKDAEPRDAGWGVQGRSFRVNDQPAFFTLTLIIESVSSTKKRHHRVQFPVNFIFHSAV